MTLLIQYDAARRALAEAKSVDEVISIRNEMEHVKLYGKQVKDRTLIAEASEIQVRAERRLGEILLEAEKTGLIRPGRPRKNPTETEGFTLKEAGIDHKTSAKAQKTASISERAFEAMVTQMRERIAAGAPIVIDRETSAQDKQQRRASREQVLGAIQNALPDKKYGVILADPEWDRTVYSRTTGMDRHAANQYPVSSDDTIKSRDVASIAAADCVCGLWCTDPHRGIDVLRAWGFEPKSYFTWVKDIVDLDVPPDIRARLQIGNRRILMVIGPPGTGFWNRDRDELLLIGTLGKPPCPAQGLQGESTWFAPRPRDAKGKIIHSAKPECSFEWIERHFPSLPKIELNRRGPPREGWDAWGNESVITDEPILTDDSPPPHGPGLNQTNTKQQQDSIP